MTISIAQAVSVWAELERALRSEHHYGSDTAEIYAYRLSPYVPTVHSNGGWGRAEDRELAAQVADSLRALLALFEGEHECRALVETAAGWVPFREWTGGLDHRVHVRIVTAGPA